MHAFTITEKIWTNCMNHPKLNECEDATSLNKQDWFLAVIIDFM